MSDNPTTDEVGTDYRALLRRFNMLRDIVAMLLLAAALLVPWNLQFGVGVPDSPTRLYLVVILATLLSSCAVATSFVSRLDPTLVNRARFWLNVPYVIVVAGFVLFGTVQSVRYSGNGEVPPGVGPAVWTGLAGSLLAAQPVLGSQVDGFRHWVAAPRLLGIAAMALAVLATLFNVYQRTRWVLPTLGNPVTGEQSATVVGMTIIYAAAALVVVLVATRWLLQDQESSRLSTVILGTAAVMAGLTVWSTGLGRDIDAFHGIAQTTSTTSVGFEGYLAWVGAAAIVAPWTLAGRRLSGRRGGSQWRDVARKCLLLIIVWFASSTALRITDLVVIANLKLPYSTYGTSVLIVLDAGATALAVWLRRRLDSDRRSGVLGVALGGVLLALAISHVALGVMLAPRMDYGASQPRYNPVHGNDLAHQITSSFDIVVCLLTLAVLCAIVLISRLGARPIDVRQVAPEEVDGVAPQSFPLTELPPQPSPRIFRTGEQAAAIDTTSPKTGPVPKIFRAAPGGAPARIASATTGQTSTPNPGPEPTGPATPAPGRPTAPSIAQILEESSKRFAAGTTYTGDERRPRP
ncbi:hypothetical protein [Mycobacterium sp. BK086]|uniref:DUF7937 domain-containing protein n=1 Tax=Mycobacterium sp. BK086 TaxID=2512165 RepID=UPI00256FCBB9|nr:hypothetical protein [Mycobacterium sp. BK086]